MSNLFDVEFTGHIIVEADSLNNARAIAQKVMDKSEGYVYVGNAEEYHA